MQIKNSNFDRQKLQCLQKADLSRKGSVDAAIKNLIDAINGSEDFFTTSSCSGRLALLVQFSDKRSCKFYMNCHEPVTYEQLTMNIGESDPQESLILKFEPFILHIQCRSLEAAKTLHTCALDCGFRNSGLTLGKNGKVTLAVRSTLGLEVPLGAERGSLLSESYLKFLIDIINEKFSINDRLTKEFEKCFCQKFCSESFS